MQYLRRFVTIRSSWRCISSSFANVHPSTSRHELDEIHKLMKNYNSTHVPIRTLALFEWMVGITNIQPNLVSYLHIIHACTAVNNLNTARKIHQWIDNDRRLSPDEYRQLQIKLIYMYAKMRHLQYVEELFQQMKSEKTIPLDALVFGTIFKGYNINGQPQKTLEIFETDSIELDAVVATCVLSACSDCHRLDIGEYVHQQIVRLKLLHNSDGTPNIRLVTALMNMYCKCGSLERARALFNQFIAVVDHVSYSTLMRAYLAANQPAQVLSLFEQLQSSSISPDPILYMDIIQACQQLALPQQAEHLHRSIPSSLIERNRQLQMNLVDMHAHCSHLDEASRLFHLLKEKDNVVLARLLHGYAVHGQGQQALKLFENMKNELNFNAQVYRMMLHACALTGGMVREAQALYTTIPQKCKTPDVVAAMVSVLARASLFDEVESLIDQYRATSQNTVPLWYAFFLVSYRSGNTERAKLILPHLVHDPLVTLLYSDMTQTVPSNDVLHHFRRNSPGICWTELFDAQKKHFVVHESQDASLHGVNIDFNDLKGLFCGHTASHLALAQHSQSSSSSTAIHLTKTRPTCSVCHDSMKDWSVQRQRDIVLRDDTRVHHFHRGHCSCNDQF